MNNEALGSGGKAKQRKPKFPPTPEQEHALSLFLGGGHVKGEAGAGCAKTTTENMLGAAVPDESGVYIAFNSSIAKEAGRTFTKNVECRTMHSFGFRAIGVKYANAGRPLPPKAPRVRSKQVAWMLEINQAYVVEITKDNKVFFGTEKLASLVLACVQRFCYSADAEISWKHMPHIPGNERWPDGSWQELATLVVYYAQRAWVDITNLHGKLRFEHDYYLKMFALSHPEIKCDFLMVDEGQDLNPVTLQIFEEQASHDTQLVLVGDRCQQIYAWRGAVNAMQTFEADDVFTLSKSFRFGPAIADEANKWLTLLNAPLRLEGHEPVGSVITELSDPRAILCRTNGQVIAEALDALEYGKKVHIAGGAHEIVAFAEAARDLHNEVPVNHPDLIGFKNWQEVKDYVMADEGAKDMRPFVNVIETHGVNKVLGMAYQCLGDKEEDKADITVSTAHKAKGREWESVRIAEDFREPAADPETGEMPAKVPDDDAMLAYVSVTRAMKQLDPGGLSWVDKWVAKHKAIVTTIKEAVK